ncbi:MULTISPECIES: nucleotide-binding protein [unclassified Dyella]|uniref:TIR domain-containing protein n=1 Tax=unclassified Dyella TaxID=2634549 RepID=UPI000C81D6F7|nr:MULTISPECIES: nucleotide-binding protein [unclassified Dyella]MDR3445046.1 nucleotide-binding protein [Dyella sp.]PMQ04997.1 hypothetical protein DyAD56_11600 [Dyella sp. AD56]
MARKTTTKTPDVLARPTTLLLPRAEVESKLQDRIKQGNEMLATTLRTPADLAEIQSKRTLWNDYNIELLKRCFDPYTLSDEYNAISLYGGFVLMDPSFAQRVDAFRRGVQGKVTNIESIIGRLELLPEPASASAPVMDVRKASGAGQSNSVFIVHGSNEAAKTRVARFVERFKLNAIILHEQPNRGRTIIEKFEKSAAEVGFAVVLLTADDIGAPKESPDQAKPRARQNVLLELGYFTASLGRDRVCVLYEKGVEIPTDYLGVVYTEFDEAGGWQLGLAREMKVAGLDVDLNNAV